MSVVVVAGGLGDLGRLITDALIETGKHEVYVMSRKTVQDHSHRVSPLTGEQYNPIIQTDYSSEDSLVEQLTEKNVSVIICTFIMDSDSVCDSELRLIRAADRCPSARRLIPSEFNVEYNVGDDVLPYPEKKYHLIARRELEKTSTLEYAYLYPGMFMDYFGLPRVPSSLRPLCFFVDPDSGLAVLPDDGEAKMSMTVTTDAARLLAAALKLDAWPRILTTAASTVSLNELVRLYEKALGRKLEVRYLPVEKWLRHETVDLPANVDIAKEYPGRFPRGLDQLRPLVADLEAGVALGAFDLGKLDQRQHLDLVKALEGRVPAPKRIEELIEEAWKPASS
ncbi:NmrA-like family protein [Biscogniauxia sp. FL1348]|nr:NmrA-like family protein [Biscogniauxia sp. FL1348]